MLTKPLSIFMGMYLLLSGQYAAENKSLTLTFTGDIMAHNVNYKMQDYSLIYKDIQSFLEEDDLTFGNLEFPVCSSQIQSSYPSFNVHPPYVQAAIDAGFDVFSLANNHSYDRGQAGCLETFVALSILKQKTVRPLYFSGIKYQNDTEYKPTLIEKKGWKIGFIALTQFSNAPYEYEHLFKVDYNLAGEVGDFMEWLKPRVNKYDLFIVSYHGDLEYMLEPSPAKVAFFYELIKAGVDIVYAHHPHVLQPYEIVSYQGRNSLILYSTGNFISGQNYGVEFDNPRDYFSYTSDSAIFTVKVEITENGPSVISAEPFLVGNIITERNDVVIEPLSVLAGLPPENKYSLYYKARYDIMRRLAAVGRIETSW